MSYRELTEGWLQKLKADGERAAEELKRRSEGGYELRLMGRRIIAPLGSLGGQDCDPMRFDCMRYAHFPSREEQQQQFENWMEDAYRRSPDFAYYLEVHTT